MDDVSSSTEEVNSESDCSSQTALPTRWNFLKSSSPRGQINICLLEMRLGYGLLPTLQHFQLALLGVFGQKGAGEH